MSSLPECEKEGSTIEKVRKTSVQKIKQKIVVAILTDTVVSTAHDANYCFLIISNRSSNKKESVLYRIVVLFRAHQDKNGAR